MTRSRLKLGIAILLLFMPTMALADTTDSTTYGSGSYGDCNYESCSITLASGGAVNLDVTPTQSGTCSIASDDVSVLTDSTAGYVVQLASSTTNTDLVNGTSTIATSSGTAASPAILTPNAWGWRVDGLGGFGSGPTSAQSNIAAPVSGFAGVPASNAAAATINTSTSSANPAVITTVWFGLCADTSALNGTYTTQVTYTATTN
jgi:hypothetical protein